MFSAFKFVSVVLLLVFTACASGEKKFAADYAAESDVRIPISITSFKNKAAETGNGRCHSWAWFNGDMGAAFQELAVDELMQYRRFAVLEREDIHQIYDSEVNLVNSSKTEKIEHGHFKKAKYTISGVVNSFEYCAGRSAVGAAASLFSSALLSAKVDQEQASVEVTLRLIDTKTGQVLASQKGTGKQTRTAVAGLGSAQDFATAVGGYSQSSLSEAIQEAIGESLNGLIRKARL